MKWAIELGEHEIEYVPWKAIKGQTLADFLIEMKDEVVIAIEPPNLVPPEEHPKLCKYLLMEHPAKSNTEPECWSSLQKV